MTDLEKAARMALEAMGLIGADLVCDAAHHKKADRHGIGEPCPIQARWHHAFAALRQALEQAEQAQPVAEGYAAQLIEALYENGDPVSVEAAEYLENHATPLEVMRHYERIEQRIKGGKHDRS